MSQSAPAGFMSRITTWLTKPQAWQLDGVDWLLFIGVIGVIVLCWREVLKAITEGIEK